MAIPENLNLESSLNPKSSLNLEPVIKTTDAAVSVVPEEVGVAVEKNVSDEKVESIENASVEKGDELTENMVSTEVADQVEEEKKIELNNAEEAMAFIARICRDEAVSNPNVTDRFGAVVTIFADKKDFLKEVAAKNTEKMSQIKDFSEKKQLFETAGKLVLQKYVDNDEKGVFIGVLGPNLASLGEVLGFGTIAFAQMEEDLYKVGNESQSEILTVQDKEPETENSGAESKTTEVQDVKSKAENNRFEMESVNVADGDEVKAPEVGTLQMETPDLEKKPQVNDGVNNETVIPVEQQNIVNIQGEIELKWTEVRESLSERVKEMRKNIEKNPESSEEIARVGSQEEVTQKNIVDLYKIIAAMEVNYPNVA